MSQFAANRQFEYPEFQIRLLPEMCFALSVVIFEELLRFGNHSWKREMGTVDWYHRGVL